MLKTVTDHIRDRLLKNVDTSPIGEVTSSLEDLRVSEWSEEFEQHMRSRLLMGAFRYGKMAAKGKPSYKRLGSIEIRLKLYEKSGNQEHLVDAANLLMLEFVEPSIDGAHFFSQAEAEHHTEKA